MLNGQFRRLYSYTKNQLKTIQKTVKLVHHTGIAHSYIFIEHQSVPCEKIGKMRVLLMAVLQLLEITYHYIGYFHYSIFEYPVDNSGIFGRSIPNKPLVAAVNGLYYSGHKPPFDTLLLNESIMFATRMPIL